MRITVKDTSSKVNNLGRGVVSEKLKELPGLSVPPEKVKPPFKVSNDK